MQSPRKSSTGNRQAVANEERDQCRNRNGKDGFHGKLVIDELWLAVLIFLNDLHCYYIRNGSRSSTGFEVGLPSATSL